MTPGKLIMWPDADIEKYQRDVQIAGWRTDSEHLRWYAKNPGEVKQLPEDRWLFHDTEGGAHITKDLIEALVWAKDSMRVRLLRMEREREK
jgi:hypothetical protein